MTWISGFVNIEIRKVSAQFGKDLGPNTTMGTTSARWIADDHHLRHRHNCSDAAVAALVLIKSDPAKFVGTDQQKVVAQWPGLISKHLQPGIHFPLFFPNQVQVHQLGVVCN